MKAKGLWFTLGVICLAVVFMVTTPVSAAESMTGGGKKKGYSDYYTKEQIKNMGIDNLDAPDLSPMKTGKLTKKDLATNSKKIWMKQMADHGIGISAKDFHKEWIDKDGWKDPKQVLIDVRTVPEYQQGHIPGAIRVDTGLMPWYLATVVPEQDMTVYLMCKGGNPNWGGARGAFWAHYMKKVGYTGKILNITDGFRGWIENGYPAQNNHGMWTFVKGTFQKPDRYLKPELRDRVRQLKPLDSWLHYPGENSW